MTLEERVEKLEKRLAQYDSIFGWELQEKLRKRETELRNVRLELTPDEDLDKSERIIKSILAHHKKCLTLHHVKE